METRGELLTEYGSTEYLARYNKTQPLVRKAPRATSLEGLREPSPWLRAEVENLEISRPINVYFATHWRNYSHYRTSVRVSDFWLRKIYFISLFTEIVYLIACYIHCVLFDFTFHVSVFVFVYISYFCHCFCNVFS